MTQDSKSTCGCGTSSCDSTAASKEKTSSCCASTPTEKPSKTSGCCGPSTDGGNACCTGGKRALWIGLVFWVIILGAVGVAVHAIWQYLSR